MHNPLVFPPKNIGFTPTERKLAQLCCKTFLKLWSYTSLYNDAGLEKNKKGKEICDLLIYFDNTIIIISDKEVTYNTKKDRCGEDGLSVAWARWKRKAIDNSVKQIEGAECWITKRYDRIYFNENCSLKFPFINKSNINKLKIYRIAIAYGCPYPLYLSSNVEDFNLNDIRTAFYWLFIKSHHSTCAT